MTIAITRAVSGSLARCELTHLPRQSIDVEKARQQHAAYEAVLRNLGVGIVRVPLQDDMPDAVFVEDTAVVVDEGAVMTRPGAASRRGEVAGVAEALRPYRDLAWIVEPGTVDGGDVLRIGKRVYVGRTGRTNAAGIEQLSQLLRRWGYEVTGVEVRGCLHLKSAATQVGRELALMNPVWVDKGVFRGVEFVEVDSREPNGANGLWVREQVVYPAGFPRTRERLEGRGVRVVTVDNRELAKAEGAMTCCSVIVD
jgi:dimethylargininase